ncbi:hypothetical protein SmJEL517_g02862 [Synchytrium microbalum]|uniref:Uncharacterized protein n=1 Tax=Synchytrium microbalum TaxID=1806994 RepID=A0A507CAD7_9FUNG|nr:uncharacterized protein SmJEL517_g02862 [Synchytrium microbalum]TPX34503.1 hypothetical protein SmJEL517_g02862 [Synchytrium microbalum]
MNTSVFTGLRGDELSTNERKFILEALASGRREDGRSKNEYRGLRISPYPKYGTVEVQLGRTRVMANVSGEIIKPNNSSANEGTIRFDTSYAASNGPPIYDTGRPHEESMLLSRSLEKIFKRTRAIDTEGLCIITGEKVWQIRVDIKILDHDGNLLDASCIAAISALMHYRRNDVTVHEAGIVIHSFEERHPLPLSIYHLPICITFAVANNGNTVILDPTHSEEQVSQGTMTLVLNIHREVCTIEKSGGVAINTSSIFSCSQIASSKVVDITQIIRAAVSNLV